VDDDETGQQRAVGSMLVNIYTLLIKVDAAERDTGQGHPPMLQKKLQVSGTREVPVMVKLSVQLRASFVCLLWGGEKKNNLGWLGSSEFGGGGSCCPGITKGTSRPCHSNAPSYYAWEKQSFCTFRATESRFSSATFLAPRFFLSHDRELTVNGGEKTL
jgi:hypothetical protein